MRYVQAAAGASAHVHCRMAVVQIASVAKICLQYLAALLLEVCKNPSQPGFNHYLFESVAALIRYSASQDSAHVGELEAQLFPAFNTVLQNDVQVHLWLS